MLSGYAGTDILEGIYKSFAVQKVYVSNIKNKSKAMFKVGDKTYGILSIFSFLPGQGSTDIRVYMDYNK